MTYEERLMEGFMRGWKASGITGEECKLFIKAFCDYMDGHRIQADGSVRDPDNWKKGISQDVYMDSLYRHVTDLWSVFNGYERFEPETKEELDKKTLLCAIMFNVQGYLYELIKEEK